MIKSFLEFHSVGQGLFYSGIISDDETESFVFVYDCGSRSGDWILNKEIDKFKKLLDRKTVDLLVISHFHDDHVNGIPYLLRGLKVNVVVLQNLSEEQRLENYLFYRKHVKNVDNELTELILDPIKYFKNLGAKKIILVSNEENYNEHIFETIIKDPNENNIIELNKHDIIREDDNGNVLYTKNNIKCKNNLWEFCFSCDVVLNKRINQIIKTYLNNKLKIADVISDENRIEKLISILNDNKVKFNESSMIFVHHPLFNSHHCLHQCYDNEFCNVFLNRKCNNSYCFKYGLASSTILTGDIILNKNICQIIKGFVNKSKRVPIIFQVPHHGSKANSKKFISFINEYSIMHSIIPCGYMYKHPSEYIYNSLNNPYIVDMYHSYKYIIKCC